MIDSWHAVKAQLAKQTGRGKLQNDPCLLKVNLCTFIIKCI
jgi:hypothetical protein